MTPQALHTPKIWQQAHSKTPQALAPCHSDSLKALLSQSWPSWFQDLATAYLAYKFL